MYTFFLRTYLSPLKRKAGLLVLVFLLVIALELWLPQVLADFIDLALAREAAGALVRVAALYLGISLFSQLAVVAETYLATDIGLTATNQLRAALTLHCLQLDLSFHNARTPGELIERVDGDVGVLNRFFSRFVIEVLGNAVLLLGVLVLLFAIDWRVGAALSVFVILTMLVLSRVSGIAVPYWTRAKEARARYFGFIEERLSGTEDIRANGAVSYVMYRLAQAARRNFRADLKAEFVATSAFGSTVLLFAVGTALSLGLAAWIYQEGTITLGTAYLIFGYTQLLTQPIERIIREIDDLQQAGASMRRVTELFGFTTVLQDGTGSLPAGPLRVDVDGVTFMYEDGADGEATASILNDISFSLAAGRSLGLLGRTGSGKTTLTRLLFRFYDPQAGTVSLGNMPLPGIRLDDLRARVGVVTQEVQLFNASVRDNLTFFDRSISDEEIEHALRQLELYDWVMSFPQALDTMLRSGGEGLSAGEAQLLAFARVFLKDPGLVILDEASSRLDPATEARLERAIDRLLRGRTAIIIAHRLTTIDRADEIMVLDQGRILEHGTRQELLEAPGSRFAQLLNTGEVLA